jgi:tetratricopeptide (TPR) repeat protein
MKAIVHLTSVQSCLIVSLALVHTISSTAADKSVSPASLDPRLRTFIKSKEGQARSLAKELRIEVPEDCWKAFELYRDGDWLKASNHFSRLRQRHLQHEGGQKQEWLASPIWQPLAEVDMAYDQFAAGGATFANAFGDGIIGSIPRGSIYFGGTDAGRGMVSALSKSHIEADPFFTLTQNALADESYLSYLRHMYGGMIYIPTPADQNDCFSKYVADAHSRLSTNKPPAGEEVKIVGDRVQVSGQAGVMAINALLAKVIFDKNPSREFYIEESTPIEWMYPHLVPHGLIMKMERRPLAELPEETVARDRDFWSDYCRLLIGGWLTSDTAVKSISQFADKVYYQGDLSGFSGDSLFVRCERARMSFSKLRAAIGGAYAWRFKDAKSTSERKRMLEAADLAFRQAFALCPTSLEVVFRYVNLLLEAGRLEDGLTVATTCEKLDPSNVKVQEMIKRLKEFRDQKGQAGPASQNLEQLEKAVQDNPSNLQAAFNLAAAFLRIQQTNRAVEILDQILNRPKPEPNAVLEVARAYAKIGNYRKLETTLEKLATVAPDSPEAWYDLAAVKASLRKDDEALIALRQALALSAKRLERDPKSRNLSAECLRDPRFAALRKRPDFPK